jgi:hypothetical protein
MAVTFHVIEQNIMTITFDIFTGSVNIHSIPWCPIQKAQYHPAVCPQTRKLSLGKPGMPRSSKLMYKIFIG